MLAHLCVTSPPPLLSGGVLLLPHSWGCSLFGSFLVTKASWEMPHPSELLISLFIATLAELEVSRVPALMSNGEVRVQAGKEPGQLVGCQRKVTQI